MVIINIRSKENGSWIAQRSPIAFKEQTTEGVEGWWVMICLLAEGPAVVDINPASPADRTVVGLVGKEPLLMW